MMNSPRRIAAIGILLASGILFAACQSAPVEKPDRSEFSVTVAYRPNADEGWQRLEVQCPPEISEPGCAELRKLPADFWEQALGKRFCSMIYGGPQEARLSGVWRGEKVNLDFSRRDGCQIERWQQLTGLLSALGLDTGNQVSVTGRSRG